MTDSLSCFPPVDRHTEDRLTEIAQILALGVLRLRERDMDRMVDPVAPENPSDFGVDFGGGQSVCASEPENNGERV